jgi:hypothetical protein
LERKIDELASKMDLLLSQFAQAPSKVTVKKLVKKSKKEVDNPIEVEPEPVTVDDLVEESLKVTPAKKKPAKLKASTLEAKKKK